MSSDANTRRSGVGRFPSRRTFLKGCLVGGVAPLFGGCTGGGADEETTPGASGRTITDGVGREVTVPDSVERVICVGPGTLRQIAYLDSTDRVVGVEEGEKRFLKRAPYNMANPELRELPTIGSTGPNASGNSEKILAQNPDVIFYFGDPSAAEELTQQTNTPVVILDVVFTIGPDGRQTLYDTWRLAGKVLNEADRASQLVESMEGFVDDLDSRTADRPESERRSAYVGAINYKGAQGIETTRNPFDPFRLTGTANVAAGVESEAPSVQISIEKLLEWDPATAFVSTRNTERVKQDIRENPGLRQVAAIADEDVHKIPPIAQYNHNYGSIIATSYHVGKTVYPDDYGDVSLEEKTDEVFQALLGASLYDDLSATFGMFEPLSVPE